jgi:hypothetical protein
MYKLGYDDGTGGTDDPSNTKDPIREYFRVSSEDPKDVVCYPNSTSNGECDIIRAVNMSRNICDCLLELTVKEKVIKRQGKTKLSSSSTSIATTNPETASGIKSWINPSNVKIDYARKDDFSIFYGMNYFNSREALKFAEEQGNYGGDGRLLNLKEHVDPSLFVLEPVLGDGVGGLEVWDEKDERWVLCDGGESELHNILNDDEEGMVVFVGKAFSEKYKQEKGGKDRTNKPTLHRVVAPPDKDIGKERRSVLFEQKYGELMNKYEKG